MEISTRPFERQHAAQVAALFQTLFRKGSTKGTLSLTRYIDEVFDAHPRADPDIRSIVATDEHGVVRGFIGVFPQRMKLHGRAIRVAVASTLMAHPTENPLTGAKLVRAVVSGPQDLLVSETATDHSYDMWQLVGGVAVPWCSLDFIRILRPAAFPLVLLSLRSERAQTLAPLGLAADAVVSRLLHNSYRPSFVEGTDQEASDDDIMACFADATDCCTLQPDLDADVLRWRLRHAAWKEMIGSCHRRIVRNRRGKRAGCYIYHGTRGGRARVMQILATPGAHGIVLDSLFAHAYAQGCAAVHGRIDNELLAPSLRRRCFYVSRSKTIVHSKSKELIEEVCSGSTMLGGLAAETWTRLIGGRFAS
jgi:Arc/MetJ family transcription regulator